VHAALTYGQAFQTTEADFNVHWNEVNSKGGIFGRKVEVTYENDNYTASDAVVAAQACADKNPFVLLGGIGYDQIPAVRNFAEKHHILYLHHSAPAKGSQGLKYSFTALPTVERMGDAFAAVTGLRFKGKKVGIIGRDSANWQPGTDAFKAGAKKYGFTIVAESKVAPSKGNYTDDILNMKNHGAEVVFTWDNALDNTQIVKQAKAQAYNPNWVVFGVNLMSQTLGEDAMNPPLVGAAMNAAYSYGNYTGNFAQYADDMKQFEAEYKKWRPNTDLSGISGDLLFWNWAAQKGMEVMLRKCGKDCNRNAFVDTFTTFKGVTSSSGCPTDFSGDGHHGSVYADFIETYRAPSGKIDFRPIKHCVRP
jgi:ABC-type branched-subunit amino acid transport system substrate-binding protein